MAEIRVKICCIQSADEAVAAAAAGAQAIGLVSAMPSGPGVIDDDRIAAIARIAPPHLLRFLLTSLLDAEAIAAQASHCGTDTVQLVDQVPTTELRRLRSLRPDLTLVQVIHVRGEIALTEARTAEPYVDALLLDSGCPDAEQRELGGTGRTHDWSLSRRIVDGSAVPVWLAGGLNPKNVTAAVQAVEPFGVDVCSGVRRDGLLDECFLTAFVEAARGH